LLINVTQLENFYSGTELGQTVSQSLANQINLVWPDPVGGTVVGYGFASPVLNRFIAQNERVINLIPQQLGINYWPSNQANKNVQTIESNWPLPSSGIERVVIMHGLEISNNYSNPLNECWRILAPEGQLILVVPNKIGLFSSNKAVPFNCSWKSSGFTLKKVRQLLINHKFQVMDHYPALFAPLGAKGISGQLTRFFESACRSYSMNLGSVIIVVARKRIFLRQNPGIGEAVKSGIEILKGAKVPNPKPATRTTRKTLNLSPIK